MSGIREAEINVAEGKKQARILSSEAYKLEQINQARGPCFSFIYLLVLTIIHNCLYSGYCRELVLYCEHFYMKWFISIL